MEFTFVMVQQIHPKFNRREVVPTWVKSERRFDFAKMTHVNKLSVTVDKFQQGFLARKSRQSQSFATMQPGLIAEYSEGLRITEGLSQTDDFCVKFRTAMRECIRHRFSIEESFGMIWMETLDEVPLLPDEQAQAYDMLIEWAKSYNSRDLFSLIPH